MNKRLTAGIGIVTSLLIGSAMAANVVSRAAATKVTAPRPAPVAVKNAALVAKPTINAFGIKLTAPVVAPTVVATPALPPLAPLDLSDMWLWNWGGKWMGSEWGNGLGPLPWKYDHISQPARADTIFTLDAAGAPELQAMNGTPANSRGLWEADVTLPQLKQGMVVAPLWLYDAGSRDEVDFELAGRNGLDVTMHASVNGAMQQQSVRLFAGQDLSGQRHRFGIKVDETAGYVEMYVDGKRVQRWDRSAAPVFISHPLKPLIEMWAADPNNPGFVNWLGAWQGLGPNEQIKMNVHGYGYTPIS